MPDRASLSRYHQKTAVMAILQSRSLFFGVALLLGFAWTNSKAANITEPPIQCLFLNRSSFPTGFIFGTAASAYQYEGAAREGGRGLSIWDVYTHTYPERIKDGSNGDVAVDQYHRYEEDVGIMKDLNLDAYRFSISWSRVLPYGTLSGGVNEEGIKYYNNLINQLHDKALTPAVTIFHWDLPQALEDQYGGFLSPQIVSHFRDYAELCFQRFGDRVKLWITLNEPYVYTNNGYAVGTFAPGRCSSWQQLNCTGGDSGTEPYTVAHNLLLSHAAAVNVYRTKYQKSQGGRIGITLVSFWFEPASEAEADKQAASRSLDFMFGWFIDPITNGQYPQSMQSNVGDRLPTFTTEQSTMLKGSFDFLGINYYTARYATNALQNNSVPPSYVTDPHVTLLTELNGVPIGPQPGLDWLYVYPKGIHDLLLHVKDNYNNPALYITENGVAEIDDPTISPPQALNDTTRIQYYYDHLCYLQAAITNSSVNMEGYFAWSLLDNFEWDSGYTARFGINYVDYKDGLRRYAKHSATWLKDFLKKQDE